jgi:hypothetical protein
MSGAGPGLTGELEQQYHTDGSHLRKPHRNSWPNWQRFSKQARSEPCRRTMCVGAGDRSLSEVLRFYVVPGLNHE